MWGTNIISDTSKSLCLAQTDCGQNSYCSYQKKYCECLPMFEISNKNNRTCGVYLFKNKLNKVLR